MTTIINLYGGPGTGKSTTAAGVFCKLKHLGMKVELVSEYAKDLTYQKSFNKLNDQGYIFAKQHHRIWQCKDSVDYIVTDSPILMSLVYITDSLYDTDEFRNYVKSVYRQYNNIDIFLCRNVEHHPYQTYGRSQTLEEAIEIDSKIDKILQNAHSDIRRVKIDHNTDTNIVLSIASIV